MSKQERMFNRLVYEMICYKAKSKDEKEKRLFNFFSQSEFHYDVFCDSVYILMTKNNNNTIFLDEFGHTHFDYINDSVFAYELLCSKDIEGYNDDIIKYIDLALFRLENRIKSLNKLRVISTVGGSPIKYS